MAQQLTNLTSIHEDAGSIPGLAQWVKDLVLLQLQLRSQLELRSGPWPGNSIGHESAKKGKKGVPVVAQWLTNSTSNHEVAGWIPGLAQWIKDPELPLDEAQVADAAQIWGCCGCGVGWQLQL